MDEETKATSVNIVNKILGVESNENTEDKILGVESIDTEDKIKRMLDN